MAKEIVRAGGTVKRNFGVEDTNVCTTLDGLYDSLVIIGRKHRLSQGMLI
jgi:hypothetical protein